MTQDSIEETRLVAVPSMAPGGLGAPRSAHFGHCDVFTLVTVRGDEVVAVETVESLPHEEGGCLAPVGLLAGLGATDIVVAGMGGRPLAGFLDAGVTVLFDDEHLQVGEAIDAMLAGTLEAMAPSMACGGGCSH